MTQHQEPQWQQATAAIQAADSVLVVTHVSPDGDAIGSALGLANALRLMGKHVTVADDDPTPDFLQWLPHADTIVHELEQGEWDVMISTDASDEERTGQVGEYGRAHSKTVINLDHHITNTYFGDIYLVVPTATSAAEVAYDWWDYIQIDWHTDIAVPLLTGLLTDTLGFRTNSVTARTLSVAQALMQAGAPLSEITQRVLDVRTWQEMNLWKQVMPTVQLNDQIIEATVMLDDMKMVGMPEDKMSTAGLVSFLNQTKEAMIAVLFKQVDDEIFKISMRAKPGYDVSDVAFQLGGGGHQLASGATVYGTIDAVRSKVMPLLHTATQKGALQIG